jgi:hypothetical protein
VKKEKTNNVEILKEEIENKKNEQLEIIQAQTAEELKKLEEKYKVTDTLKNSFGILAYVFIGLFIFVISIGDCVRLVRYSINKLRSGKKNSIQNDFNKVQIKKTNKR